MDPKLAETKSESKVERQKRIASVYDFNDTYVPNSGAAANRMKNVTVVKPIVYGNTARYFGKKREEDGHTHGWSFYLKSYDNEDPSSYIQRVHIKLHESYPNANRVINKPPYEVHETGWGEFEVTLKIFFNDPNEKPLTIFHLLKLFSVDPEVQAGNKNLVNEYYDEIIFHEPSSFFYQMLTSTKTLSPGSNKKHETDFKEKEIQTLEKMHNAKSKIRAEIRELKDRLKLAQENLQLVKEKIEGEDIVIEDLNI